METEQPFFILGLPRTRTAWLSVVMSMCGAPCFHEGMRDFTSFEAYADGREARGDADPTLIYWTSQLLDRWPDARFIVISRDPDESLKDLIAASLPELEEELRTSWGSAWNAFATTRDLLRGNENALFVEFDQLGDSEVIASMVAFAGGSRPTLAAVDRWQRLQVTTRLVHPRELVQPAVQVLPDTRVKAGDICDISGLSAEMYSPSDFAMVAGWWAAHIRTPLNEAVLPPLGIIVKLEGSPVAALWCYESYGVPVAEIAYPVTCPALSFKDARRALTFAVSCIISAAGKGHEPEASFRVFKVLCPSGMGRFLERLGFQHALTERKPMTLTL